MDHASLIAQHDAIDATAQVLLGFVRDPVPEHAEASRTLSLLSALVRDHLAVEDPVIYETVRVTLATRHGDLVAATVAELDELKHGWTNYLYRWNEAAVVADWIGFGAECEDMLGRLRARVLRETSILYSLAEHYAVIDGGA